MECALKLILFLASGRKFTEHLKPSDMHTIQMLSKHSWSHADFYSILNNAAIFRKVL